MPFHYLSDKAAGQKCSLEMPVLCLGHISWPVCISFLCVLCGCICVSMCSVLTIVFECQPIGASFWLDGFVGSATGVYAADSNIKCLGFQQSSISSVPFSASFSFSLFSFGLLYHTVTIKECLCVLLLNLRIIISFWEEIFFCLLFWPWFTMNNVSSVYCHNFIL